eukprot:scaffold1307_cov200-Pinguiococcus_pyrenoidosus.AAC.159
MLGLGVKSGGVWRWCSTSRWRRLNGSMIYPISRRRGPQWSSGKVPLVLLNTQKRKDAGSLNCGVSAERSADTLHYASTIHLHKEHTSQDHSMISKIYPISISTIGPNIPVRQPQHHVTGIGS